MKVSLAIALLLFLSGCGRRKEVAEEAQPQSKKEELLNIILSFDQETFPGGVWEEYMKDKYQTFKAEFSELEKMGEKGYSLALDYDFREGKDSIGGIWFRVDGYDFKSAEYFGFWAKGEPKLGYSQVIGITFESKFGQRVTKYFGKLQDVWTRVEIPLREPEFEKLKEVVEINIFLDRRYATQRVGRIYLDNFYLR